MIRQFTPGAMTLLAMTSIWVATVAQESSVQRSFDGDTVRLELSAGHYRVSASSDNRVRVTPRTGLDRVSTRISLNFLSTQATVRVIGQDGFDADIELPARVNVVLDLAGGSLQVDGVAGVRSFHWTGHGGQTLQIRLEKGRITEKN